MPSAERGAAHAEYAVCVVAVGVACVFAFGGFGGEVEKDVLMAASSIEEMASEAFGSGEGEPGSEEERSRGRDGRRLGRPPPDRRPPAGTTDLTSGGDYDPFHTDWYEELYVGQSSGLTLAETIDDYEALSEEEQYDKALDFINEVLKGDPESLSNAQREVLRKAFGHLNDPDHKAHGERDDLLERLNAKGEDGDFDFNGGRKDPYAHDHDDDEDDDDDDEWVAWALGGLLAFNALTGGGGGYGGGGGGGRYGKPGDYTNAMLGPIGPHKGVSAGRMGSQEQAGPGTGGPGRRASKPRPERKPGAARERPKRIEREPVSAAARREALLGVTPMDVDESVASVLTAVDGGQWQLPPAPDGSPRGKVTLRKYGDEDFSLQMSIFSSTGRQLRGCLEEGEGACELRLHRGPLNDVLDALPQGQVTTPPSEGNSDFGVTVKVDSYDPTNRRFVVSMEEWKEELGKSSHLPILAGSGRRAPVRWVPKSDYGAARDGLVSGLDGVVEQEQRKQQRRWGRDRPQPGGGRLRAPVARDAKDLAKALSGVDVAKPYGDAEADEEALSAARRALAQSVDGGFLKLRAREGDDPAQPPEWVRVDVDVDADDEAGRVYLSPSSRSGKLEQGDCARGRETGNVCKFKVAGGPELTPNYSNERGHRNQAYVSLDAFLSAMERHGVPIIRSDNGVVDLVPEDEYPAKHQNALKDLQTLAKTSGGRDRARGDRDRRSQRGSTWPPRQGRALLSGERIDKPLSRRSRIKEAKRAYARDSEEHVRSLVGEVWYSEGSMDPDWDSTYVDAEEAGAPTFRLREGNDFYWEPMTPTAERLLEENRAACLEGKAECPVPGTFVIDPDNTDIKYWTFGPDEVMYLDDAGFIRPAPAESPRVRRSRQSADYSLEEPTTSSDRAPHLAEVFAGLMPDPNRFLSTDGDRLAGQVAHIVDSSGAVVAVRYTSEETGDLTAIQFGPDNAWYDEDGLRLDAETRVPRPVSPSHRMTAADDWQWGSRLDPFDGAKFSGLTPTETFAYAPFTGVVNQSVNHVWYLEHRDGSKSWFRGVPVPTTRRVEEGARLGPVTERTMYYGLQAPDGSWHDLEQMFGRERVGDPRAYASRRREIMRLFQTGRDRGPRRRAGASDDSVIVTTEDGAPDPDFDLSRFGDPPRRSPLSL